MNYYKYPKYINLIGIEFEGAYKRDIINFLEQDRLLEVTTDGSVSIEDLDSDIYAPYEVKTKPLNSKQLASIIRSFKVMENNKNYVINESCGLHFHISLNKSYQAYCQRIEFYNDMYNFFKNKYPRIFNARSGNQYCRAELRDYERQSQFNRASGDRYHIVNYSLEGDRHIPTIEIRFYGGRYASIKGLYQVIKQTIDIIGKHTKIDRTISDYKEEHQEVCHFLPVDIDALKSVELNKSVDIPSLKYASKRVRSKTEYIIKQSGGIKSVDYRIKAIKQLDPIIINFQTI